MQRQVLGLTLELLVEAHLGTLQHEGGGGDLILGWIAGDK